MTHLLLTIGIMTIFSCQTLATPQVPDLLIYNGDTLQLFANPMSEHPHARSLSRRFFRGKNRCYSTACWRGYQAVWLIQNKQLYLVAILNCCRMEKTVQQKANLKKLFGKKFINGKVKADWVNACMIAPQGNLITRYAYVGYESIYTFENEFCFKKGRLTKITIYDNSRSRRSIYSNDSILRAFIYSKIDWAKLPDSIHPRVVIQFSANEQGQIDQVKVVKGYNKIYDQEALRVVQVIPQWDIFYRRGQHFRIPWNLPIHFSIENRKKYSP